MSDSFKGIDYSELHRALGLKLEDDIEVDLPALQDHLNAMFSRHVFLDEDKEDSVRELSRETELCRSYIRAHIDHLRDHRCGSVEAIPVYEALLEVKEPTIFISILTNLIGLMWC